MVVAKDMLRKILGQVVQHFGMGSFGLLPDAGRMQSPPWSSTRCLSFMASFDVVILCLKIQDVICRRGLNLDLEDQSVDLSILQSINLLERLDKCGLIHGRCILSISSQPRERQA